MAKEMTPTQLNHRRRLQSTITRTTSAMGLGGLAALGTGAVITRKPGVLRAIPKYAKLSDEKLAAKGVSMGNLSRNIGVVAGGIGGAGGFNTAAIYAAEGKRKKAVAKNYEPDGVFGEIGKASAWQPSASTYDPESLRHRRADVYPDTAAAAGGTAGGLLAYRQGKKAVASYRKVADPADLGRLLTHRANKLEAAGEKTAKGVREFGNTKLAEAKGFKRAGHLHSAKGIGLAVGGVAAGAGAHNLLRRRADSDSWATYSKSATSAFGVTHD